MKIDARTSGIIISPKPIGSGGNFAALIGSVDALPGTSDSRAVGFQARGMFGRMEATQTPSSHPQIPDQPKSEKTLTSSTVEQPGHATGDRARSGSPPITAGPPSHAQNNALHARATPKSPSHPAEARTNDAGPWLERPGDLMVTVESEATLAQTRRPNMSARRTSSVVTVTGSGDGEGVSVTLAMAGLTAQDQDEFRRRAETLAQDHRLALDKVTFAGEGATRAGLRGTTGWR